MAYHYCYFIVKVAGQFALSGAREEVKNLALPVGEANYVTQYHDVKRLLGFLINYPKSSYS